MFFRYLKLLSRNRKRKAIEEIAERLGKYICRRYYNVYEIAAA
jgi:hypothetical protein